MLKIKKPVSKEPALTYKIILFTVDHLPAQIHALFFIQLPEVRIA